MGEATVRGFDEAETREYLVSLLRRRSRQALKRAIWCLEQGDYDGASFNAEQSVQLYLKSVILEFADMPARGHEIRKLLGYVGSLLGIEGEVSEFIGSNRLKFLALEDAYYNARYLPKEYDRESAKELIRFAKEVISFVETKRRSAGKKS